MIGGLIILLLFLCTYIFNNDKKTLLRLFLGLWSGILLVSQLKLFGMRPYGSSAEICILIGSISFWAGYLLKYTKIATIKFRFGKYNQCESERVINIYAVRIVAILSFLFYSMVTIRVIGVLLSGTSYLALRNMYGGENSYLSAAESWLNGWIFAPLIFAFIPLLALFITKKRKTILALFLWL